MLYEHHMRHRSIGPGESAVCVFPIPSERPGAINHHPLMPSLDAVADFGVCPAFSLARSTAAYHLTEWRRPAGIFGGDDVGLQHLVVCERGGITWQEMLADRAGASLRATSLRRGRGRPPDAHRVKGAIIPSAATLQAPQRAIHRISARPDRCASDTCTAKPGAVCSSGTAGNPTAREVSDGVLDLGVISTTGNRAFARSMPACSIPSEQPYRGHQRTNPS